MLRPRVGDLLFTLPVHNLLGESVQWHIDSGSIWWTDIENTKIFQYCTSTKSLKSFIMPDRVGCFAFIKNDHRIIVAFAKGIAFYDYHNETLEWLSQPEIHLIGNRFNDGKVDHNGRFWAGTMVENSKESDSLGALYVYEYQKGISKIIEHINISNSLCWSPDSKTMYHSDSAEQKIYKYDFDDKTGNVANKNIFATTKLNIFPDGATVDSNGGVWCAQWGGAEVIRYLPDGTISLIHKLPTSQPTCIAIGGPRMDWLIVTSAKINLSEEQLQKEPLAGNVFVYKLHDVFGLPEPLYKNS